MIRPRIPDIHRFYIFQYPCSSVLSVGDSFCCLRFILPQIPQIFTDFIYPRIRVHLCYLWEIPSAAYDLFSHRFHRFYISQNPCSSVLSVGDSFAP